MHLIISGSSDSTCYIPKINVFLIRQCVCSADVEVVCLNSRPGYLGCIGCCQVFSKVLIVRENIDIGWVMMGSENHAPPFRVCNCSSNLEFWVGGDRLQRPRNPPVRWFVNVASTGEDSRGNAPWNQVRGG